MRYASTRPRIVSGPTPPNFIASAAASVCSASCQAEMSGTSTISPTRFEPAGSRNVRDGFHLDADDLSAVRPSDEPADRLSTHVLALFGERNELGVARSHYEQANRAFDRGDWDAANAQFRSACDATYDALAAYHGSPSGKTGGRARQRLQANRFLDTDEAELLRAFMAFAGRAGSVRRRRRAAAPTLRYSGYRVRSLEARIDDRNSREGAARPDRQRSVPSRPPEQCARGAP